MKLWSCLVLTGLSCFTSILSAESLLRYQFETELGGTAILSPLADLNPGMKNGIPHSSTPWLDNDFQGTGGLLSNSYIPLGLSALPENEDFRHGYSYLYSRGTTDTTHIIQYEFPVDEVYSADTVYMGNEIYRLHHKRTGFDSYEDYYYSTLVQIFKHDKDSQTWKKILDFSDTPQKHHWLSFIDSSGLIVYGQSDFNWSSAKDFIVYDPEQPDTRKRFTAQSGFEPTQVLKFERLQGEANYKLLTTRPHQIGEQKMMAAIYDSAIDSMEYIPEPVTSGIGDAQLFVYDDKYYALDRPGRQTYEFQIFRLDPKNEWKAEKLAEFDGDFSLKSHDNYTAGGRTLTAPGLFITSLALDRYGEVSAPYSYPIVGYQYFDFATESLSEHPLTSLISEGSYEPRRQAKAYSHIDMAYTRFYDINQRVFVDYILSPYHYFEKQGNGRRWGNLTQVGEEFTLQSYVEDANHVRYTRYFFNAGLEVIETQSGIAGIDAINSTHSPHNRTHGFNTIASYDHKFAEGTLYTFREQNTVSLFWKNNGHAPIKVIEDLGALLQDSDFANVVELDNTDAPPVRILGTLNNRLMITGYNNRIGAETFVLDLHCETGLTISSPRYRNNNLYLNKNTDYRLPLSVRSINAITPDDISLPQVAGVDWQIKQDIDDSLYLEIHLADAFEAADALEIQINNGCASSKMRLSLQTQDNRAGKSVDHDYDGDGVTDLAFRRPNIALYYIKNSDSGDVSSDKFGLSSRDIAVPGDYDGDGKTDIAVRRPHTATWYIKNSSGTHFQSQRNDDVQRLRLGTVVIDIPVPADYDGDGITDIAVWRPTTGIWYIRLSSDNPNALSQNITSFKISASKDDIPVPADYNGDGKAEAAIYNRQDGHWYIRRVTEDPEMEYTEVSHLGYAFEDAIPVPADFDGDGKVDLAVWVPSQQHFYGITRKRIPVFSDIGSEADDIPIPGDYDGDGKTDFAIKRPSNSQVIIENSLTETISLDRFGTMPQDIMLNAPIEYRMDLLQM